MSTEEEYKELSAKLRYGLELAEQRLIEETARREEIGRASCRERVSVQV